MTGSAIGFSGTVLVEARKCRYVSNDFLVHPSAGWLAIISTSGPYPTGMLSYEDGYANDPNDPGGETNWGISKRAYPDVDQEPHPRSGDANLSSRLLGLARM